MDLKKVKALLADYYEGRTSKEEEDYLKDFFSKEKVPPGMEADRLLFLSLAGSADEVIPDRQFDEKLFAAIAEQEDQNNNANNRKTGSKSLTRHLIIAVSGIAAGLMILIGSYFILAERQGEESLLAGEEYTVEETMLAYEEARNALLLVSGVMNRGTAELESLSKLEAATRELHMINKFHHGLYELQTLAKFDETVTSLGNN